jgi:hypothetical protein
MFAERPRPCDLRHATPGQLSAAWEAFCQVNDLAFIQEAFTVPQDGPKSDGGGLDMADSAVMLSQRLGGSRAPEELLRIPMQAFLALFDSLKHIQNVQEGRPADCDAPSESEVADIRNAFAGSGIEVQ